MKNIQLDGQTTAGVNTGGAAVGTTASAISNNQRELKWGVQITAGSANTASIWVGRRSTLTPGTTDETDGIELTPGVSIMVPASGEYKVFAVSTAAAQRLSYLSF